MLTKYCVFGQALVRAPEAIAISTDSDVSGGNVNSDGCEDFTRAVVLNSFKGFGLFYKYQE